MKEFIINKTNENQRLDKYLKRILPASSNSFLYKMLRKKNIELNGKRAKGDEILKSGDSIKIFFSDDTFSKMSESVKEDLNIFLDAYKNIKNVEIVFEHEDFMIVNKPEGVLTQRDKSSVPSLNEWCIGYLLSK
ncbi:MAG: RluA family pseudouridine synthase, partial [Lachnospiraceae bacterium]|nr:RluA family pseudouridine synthase [Lachnospiraceae bacterium]